MTTTTPDTRPTLGRGTSAPAEDAAHGWYLYGVTRCGSPAAVLADADAGCDGTAPAAERLQLIECAGLAAVVRRVPLADFSLDVLQERLRSATVLESMVRSHNQAIEAVHARQAILPAKFGTVYAHADDIVSALRAACDTLLPQLHRLEGCDEWALHVYADGAAVGEWVAARNPTVARLREQSAAARPGRAYFLGRQLRDEMHGATRQALASLGREAFDRLLGVAAAGRSTTIGASVDGADEVEILRAAFLVARDGAERFAEAVRAVADAGAGLRCECTGPWPPYSFATGDEEAR